MSFKPTNLYEGALVAYGGVVVVVALVATPLYIGLGEDSADSSPLKAVTRSTTTVARVSDPCKAAIERMISCSKDAKVRQKISARKDRFAAECRRSKKDVRRAERCVKRSSCASFERCLSGG